MSSENRDSESSDESRGAEEPIDLHAPPDEEREGSKWGSYALAGLLVAIFLVGFLRLVYPGQTGLLIGAIGALFGLVVLAFAVRERFG